jgi:hypothetical protein
MSLREPGEAAGGRGDPLLATHPGSPRAQEQLYCLAVIFSAPDAIIHSLTFCELIYLPLFLFKWKEVCTSKRYQAPILAVPGRFLVILFLPFSSNRSIVANARSSTQLQKPPPANSRRFGVFFTSLSVHVASFSLLAEPRD